MALLRDITNKIETALVRCPWRPSVFDCKVMALFSVAFAAWSFFEVAEADYGSALICFGNTLLFGIWARALWRRERA
jgi:hypothetical protein